LGQTEILSAGDVVFQPRKVRGHVLIYIHKEQALADVGRRYPADVTVERIGDLLSYGLSNLRAV
jgi:hypothetical protein